MRNGKALLSLIAAMLAAFAVACQGSHTAPPVEGSQEAAAPRPQAAPGSREEEVVAMTPLRRRIAERLVQSQQVVASRAGYCRLIQIGNVPWLCK